MQPYWVTFEDGQSACCEGQSALDAIQIAEKVSGKKVAAAPGKQPVSWSAESRQIKPLPYAAAPVVWQLDHPVYGKSWTLCHSPKQCAGKTACPKNRACSE